MTKVWWQYVLVFLLSLCAGAVFTILTFSPISKNLTTSATSKILSALLETKEGTAEFDLSLIAEGTNLNASGTAVFDFDDNPSIKLLIDATFNDKTFDVDITFKNSTAFVKINDTALKIEISNSNLSLDSFDALLPMLTPLLSNVNLPFDISNISMDNLQGLVTKAEEKEFDDHYEIIFPLDDIIQGLGNAVLVSDLEYNITQIYLEKPETKARLAAEPTFALSFNANTNLAEKPAEIEITQEQEAFADLTECFDFVNIALPKITAKNIGFELNSNLFNLNTIGSGIVCLSDLTAQFNSNLFGIEAQLVFENNTVFATCFDTKIKIGVDYLKELLTQKIPELNFEMPKLENGFEAIVSKIASFDLNKINDFLKVFEEEIVCEDQNDDGTINQTTKTQKTYSIQIKGFNINFVAIDKNLEKIEIFNKSLFDTALLSMSLFDIEDAKTTKIDEQEFLDIRQIVSKIDFFKELLSTKKVSLDINIDAFETEFNVLLDLDLNNGIKAKATTFVFNNKLEILFDGQVFYFSFKNFDFCLSKDDLENLSAQIFDFIFENEELSNLASSICETILSKIPQEVLALANIKDDFAEFDLNTLDLSNLNLSNFVDKFFVDANKIELNVLDCVVVINFKDEKLNNICFEKADFAFNVNLTCDKTLEISKNSNKNYQDLKNIKPVLDFAKNLLNKKALSGKLAVLIDDIHTTVDFKLKPNFENIFESELFAKTTLLGKNVELTLKDQTIFVCFDGLGFSITLNELFDVLDKTNLLSQIENELNKFDLQNMADDLLKDFDEPFEELEFLNNFVDENIVIYIQKFVSFLKQNLSRTCLLVSQNGIAALCGTDGVRIDFENEEIDVVSVFYKNIMLQVCDFAFDFEIETPQNFVSFYDLKIVKDKMQGFVEGKQYAVEFLANIENENVNVKVFADLSSELKLKIQTTLLNKNLEIIVVGNSVFASFDKFNIEININDMANIATIANNYVDFDLNFVVDILNQAYDIVINPYEQASLMLKSLEEQLVNTLTTTNFDFDLSVLPQLLFLAAPFDFNINLNKTNNDAVLEANFENHFARLEFFDYELKQICYENQSEKSISMTLNFVDFERIYVDYSKNYIKASSIVNLLNKISTACGSTNLLNGFAFSGSANILVNALGQEINLPINEFGVEFDGSFVSAYALIEFKGLDIKVIFKNNSIFVCINGLKTKIDFEDFDDLLAFAKSQFGENEIFAQIEDAKQKFENSTSAQELMQNFGFEMSLDDILNFVFNEFEFDLNDEKLSFNAFGINLELNFANELKLNASFDEILANIEFKQGFNLPEVQENEFVSVLSLLEKYENTISLIQTNKFAGKIDISIAPYKTYELLYNIDLNGGIKAHIETNILGKDINIWLINETVFVDFDGLKLKTTFDDAKDLISKLEYFGINVDFDVVTQELTALAEQKLETMLSKINFDSFDLTNFVSALTNSTEQIAVQFANLLNFVEIDVENDFVQSILQNALNGSTLSINFENETFSGITLNNNALQIKASVFEDENEISVDQSLFNNLNNLSPLIDFARDVYASKELSGKLEFDYQGEKLEIEFAVKLNLDDITLSSAQINAVLFGVPITITFENKTLFIEFKDVQVKITIDEITQLLTEFGFDSIFDEIAEKLNIENLTQTISNENINEDIKILENFVDDETLNLVNGIVLLVLENFDKFELISNVNQTKVIFDNFQAMVNYQNGNIKNIFASFKDYEVKLTNLNAQANILAPSNAASFSKIQETAQNVVDYILGKHYTFEVNGTYNDEIYSANISLDLTDELKLKVNTTLFNKDIELVLIGTTFYVSVGQYKISGNISDVSNLLSIAKEYVDFDVNAIEDLINEFSIYLTCPYQEISTIAVNAITETIEKTQNIDIKNILELLSTNFEFELSLIEKENSLALNAEYNNLEFGINFDSNNLKSVNFVGNIKGLTNAQIKITDFNEITVPTQNFVQIANLVKMYEQVSSVLDSTNLLNNFAFSGSANVQMSFAGQEINLPINEFGVEFDGSFVSAYALIEFKGLDIKVIFKNNSIFVCINGLKTKIDFEDFDDLLAFAKSQFGENEIFAQIEDAKQKFENSTSAQELMQNFGFEMSLDDILNFVFNEFEFDLNDEKLSFNAFGINLELNFANELKLNASFDEILANIEFKQGFNLPEVQENEFVSVLSLLEKYENTISLIQTNKFAGKIDISIAPYKTYELLYNIDLNGGIKAHIETNILGKDINIWLINETVFVDFDGLKLKTTFDDAKDLISKLEYFGINVDFDVVTQELTALAEQKLETMLSKINFDSFDLTNFVSALTNSTEQIAVQFANLLNFVEIDVENDFVQSILQNALNGSTLSINFENETFSGITLNNNALQIKASVFEDENEISVDQSLFNNLNNLSPLIDFARDVYASKELSGKLEFDYQGEKLEIEFAVKLNLDDITLSSAQINAVLFGVPITITFENKTLFIEFKDVQVKITIDEITQLLTEFGFDSIFDEIAEKLNIENLTQTISNENINEDIKILENFVDDETLNLVNGIVLLVLENFDKFELISNVNQTKVIFDNFQAMVNYQNGNIKNIFASFKDYEVKLTNLNAQANILAPSNAASFSKIQETAQNVVDYILGKHYTFEVNGTYNDEIYSANISLDLTDELKLKVNTTLFNKDIELVLIGTTFYVSVGMYQISGTIDDVCDALDKIEEILEITGTQSFNKKQIKDLINTYKVYLTNPFDEICNLIHEETEKLTNNFNSQSLNVADIMKLLNSTIPNFELLLTEDLLNVSFDEHQANVVFENKNLSQINYEGNLQGLTNLSLQLKEFEEITANHDNILSVSNLLKLFDCVNVFSSDMTLGGTGTINFNLLDNENTIQIDYGVKFSKSNGLEGYLSTTFKGININITLKNNTIYVDFAGMAIKIANSELNDLMLWLNETFGIELNVNLDSSASLGIMDILFDKILDISLTSNTFNLNFDGYVIGLVFDDIINTITVEKEGLFDFTLQNSENISLSPSNFDENRYHSYTTLTNSVDAIMDLVDLKQVNVDAVVDLFRNNKKAYVGTLGLALDGSTENLRIHANGTLSSTTASESHTVELDFENNYLYANYNNLKLSLSRNSIKEILIIALQFVGIDPDSIGILGAVDEDMKVDMENLKDTLPEINMANPFDLLTYIKAFDLENNTFTVVVDGSKITATASQKDITVVVKFENNKLSKIEFKNIYTGISETENFNMTLNFKTFAPITNVSNKNQFIDISQSSSLLRAFLNTTNLTDYKITATVKVVASILGVDINKTINLEAGVKKVDGDITAYLKLTNIPVYPIVNASTLDLSNKSRDLSIYYKDGFVYVHRYDTRTLNRSRTFETKVAAGNFVNNIDYYLLEFGIGFESTVMDAIQEAIDKTKGHVIEPSNVLKGYTYNGSNTHTIVINMEEIANNDKLENATIKISTINNANTQNKDYVYKLDFSLYMPIASVFDLTLSTSDMTLDDIGSPVDVSCATNYISSYQYPENAEFEDGSRMGDSYTVSFNTNGGNNVSSVSGQVGNTVNLVTPTKNNFDNGVYKTTFTFAGWFNNPDFAGSQITSMTIPRGGATLYAKWNESTSYYRTITLNSNYSSNLNSSTTLLQGTNFVLPVLLTQTQDDGITKQTFNFVGWFDNKNFEGQPIENVVVGTENVELFAKWNIVTEFYQTISFDTGFNWSNITSITTFAGKEIVLPTPETFFENTQTTRTTYTFVCWTLNDKAVSQNFVVPQNDITLIAIWNIDTKHLRTINFTSSTSWFSSDSISASEGANITLPTPNPLTHDVDEFDTTKTVKTFAFAGWKLNGEFVNFDVMPAGESDSFELVDEWTLVDTKHYNTIAFDANYDGISVNSITTPEGNSITLPCLDSQIQDNGTTFLTYTFAGWFDENNNQFVSTQMPESENVCTFSLTAHWNITTEYYLTLSSTYGFNGSGNAETVKQHFLAGANMTNYLNSNIPQTVNKTFSSYKMTYTFANWNSQSTTMPQSATTISANFVKTKTITISFNTNFVNPTIVNNESHITAPSVTETKNKSIDSSVATYTVSWQGDENSSTTISRPTGSGTIDAKMKIYHSSGDLTGLNSTTYTFRIVSWNNSSNPTNVTTVTQSLKNTTGILLKVYYGQITISNASYATGNLTLSSNTTLSAVWQKI